MANPLLLSCDGCGQLADSAHISRRLRRLEWATRFRPLHIQTLLLAGVAPASDREYLYAPEGKFQGGAENVLRWARIAYEGKSVEAVLAEFQKAGFMLVHLLECPVEADQQVGPLIQKALPGTVARIRRSLKPKRVVLLAAEPWAERLQAPDLGCPVELTTL